MNALTGTAIPASSGSKAVGAPGAGLVKQPGYILVVPQGTGNINTGQVGAGWPVAARLLVRQPGPTP
jgi:hypothetical protein